MTHLKPRESSDSQYTPPWQQAPQTTMSRPEKPQMKPQLSHQSSKSFSVGDDPLFTTPADLLCPITLSLFQDPVCNALGQVYERAAIQRHLVQAAINGQPPTDPISNAILPSLDLVPVYPMKSRAAQYRESTARGCVQIAASPECPDPVRYLRRAADLVVMAADASSSTPGISSGGSSSNLTPAGSFNSNSTMLQSGAAGTAAAGSGLALHIPGMTLDFARYLTAHQGSAYDALALKYFGNELLRADCPDAAADVFYRLLLEADERVQQAEYLQLCLDCWTSSSNSSSSSSGTDSEAPAGPEAAAAAGAGSSLSSTGRASGGSGQEQSQEQQQQQAPSGMAATADPVAAAAAHNPVIVGKLADFVQRQRCLSPSAIVHMLQGMNHGPAMALQLCQVLLARAAAAAAAAAGPDAEAAMGLPGGLGGALEVLVSFVELGQLQLQEQLQGLAAKVAVLDAAHQQQQLAASGSAADGDMTGASSRGIGSGADAAAGKGAAAAKLGAGVQGGSSKCRRRRDGISWKGGKGVDVVLGRIARVAAAGTLTVASVVGGNHLLLRLARVGPLIYLLRAGL